jgi:acyl carrier protein
MPEEPDADLASKVIAVIAKAQRIPAETIALDSTFEQLKIDSLDGINIVFAIENEFGINIPDEGAQNLRSVRETVDGVARLLEEKASVAKSTNGVPAPVDGDKSA